MSFRILVARQRGMCAGVDRAIRVVEKTLERYGKEQVYVLHEVVHNRHVVEDLRAQGARFVDTLEDVPCGSVLIFSAHGVSIETWQEAARRGLTVVDATCPVVSGIHRKMNRAGDQHLEVVVIGHPGHQEVIGTIGQYRGPRDQVHVILKPEDVADLHLDAGGGRAMFTTQTTLSADETAKTVAALRQAFPAIRGPRTDDTCNATQLRQNAVRELAGLCDLVIIAGSANSSNSNRLREVAASRGVRAELVDDYRGIDPEWLKGVRTLGISAGASAPEYVVEEIVQWLREHGGAEVCESGAAVKEKHFLLPKEIRDSGPEQEPHRRD